jgi:tetratricopeptide (TPR) repeat protein
VLILLTSLVSLAEAQSKDRAREAYRRGTHAYDFGEYDKALEAFKEAYDQFEDPAILFNIAQCHRQLGHAEEALRVYQSYLRNAKSPPNSDEVRSIIKRLEQVRAEEIATRRRPPEGTLPEPTETSEPVASPEPAATPAPEATPPVPVPVPPTSSARPGRGLLIGGIAVAAVGAAGIVLGGAMGALAKSASDDLTRASKNSEPYDANKYKTGHAEQLASTALFAVGGAALAAGVIVAILGSRHKNEPKVSLGAGARGAAIFVEGGF